MTSGDVLLIVTIVIPRKIRRSDNASLADFSFISQLPVADTDIELRGKGGGGGLGLPCRLFVLLRSFLFVPKTREVGGASLNHCHWTSFEDNNVRHENCAFLGLLSSLNVVRYLENTHLVVRKMKRCQNGNPEPHVMERGLSKTICSSTVSRTNQNTGPPTAAAASYLIGHTLSLHIQLDLAIRLSQPLLFHFSCRFFE